MSSATGQQMPITIADKIAAGAALKDQGNEHFKVGDMAKAAHSYRSVFLYVNGLVDRGSTLATYAAGSSLNVSSGDGSNPWRAPARGRLLTTARPPGSWTKHNP